MRRVTFFLGISIVFLFFSCNGDNNNKTNAETINIKAAIDEDKYDSWVIVGELEQNKPILTASKDKLINSLSKSLQVITGKKSEINDASLEILDQAYYLVFTGKNERVTFYVQKSRDNNQLKAAVKTACRTIDCSHEQFGCIVKYPDNLPGEEGIGYCTPCDNGGMCEKISTNAGDPIIQP